MKNTYFFLFILVFYASAADNIQNKISKILPSGININFYEESKIPNFYVVNVANNQILYVSKDFKYVIAGEVIEIGDSNISSMNDQYQKKFITQVISSISEDETIKFQSKEVKHELFVFTDVSCSYCRLFHSEIDEYLELGITVKYLAFPRDGLESNIADEMEKVWCNEDRKLALTALKKGKSVKNEVCTNPVEEHYRKGALIGITGTPALILEDGTKLSGYIPASELIKILNNG
tara:strand:- start:2676 stop:3380 length:705 start_codon:yes stop_codon:yes gene_type:complete